MHEPLDDAPSRLAAAAIASAMVSEAIGVGVCAYTGWVAAPATTTASAAFQKQARGARIKDAASAT